MEVEAFIPSAAGAVFVVWCVEMFLTRRRIKRLDRKFLKRVDELTGKDGES